MIAEPSRNTTSSPSTQVEDLSPEQQQRLTDILDDYLRGLEEGDPIHVPTVLEQNPDLANTLRTYLSKLDSLRGIASGFQSHGDLEPLISGESGGSVGSLQLGDNTNIRYVGRGVRVIVYEAQHRALDRRVALKLLPLASMLDSRQIARFKNESNAAAQLQHDHIVPVYNVGVERGIHYYAMQFIDGKTVETSISESTDLDPQAQYRQAVFTAARVADALQCAHECSIVHRDIKPSNLILDKSGKVWVADFGLARCQNEHSLTLSGDLVGTMRYMSPEQAVGRAERVDHRTDIYSLGATLYEMLTGLPAIEGADGPSVLSAITNQPVPRARRLKPELPPEIDFVLQKSMAKDKDDRYATAAEFADDLQAILERRPTLAQPPSKLSLLRQWTDRHRKVVVATSMSLALGVAGMLIGLIIIANKNEELRASHQIADRNFKKAQEAVGTLGIAVSAQLASIPGTEHVRQSVLRHTLAHYQDFVHEAQGDSKLQSELALTQSRIGTLIGELESAQASLTHFAKAEDSYRVLLATTPGSKEALQGRARNLNQMGLAHAASGDTNAAQRCYAHAIEIQAELTSNDANLSYQTDLALSQSNLGLLLAHSGNEAQAESELDQAIATLSKVVQTDQTNILANRGLAAALTNLSSLTLPSSPSQAIALLEDAIDCQLRIRNSAPSRLKASSEIATTYNALGSAQLSLNNAVQALEAFEQAIAIHRRLHDIAPAVNSYRFDLAMSLNNVASAHYQMKQFMPSMRAAREAIQLQSACLERSPRDAISLSRLGIMHGNLATALSAQGMLTDAMLWYQKAIDCQNESIAINPKDESPRSSLMQHYASLLRYQVQQQRWPAANRTLSAYREAAMNQPEQLLVAATNLAEIAKQASVTKHQECFAANIAALIVSAKDMGVSIDPTILDNEAFAKFSNHTQIRRAVQQ